MVEIVQLLFPGVGVLLLLGGIGLVRKGRYYSRQSKRVAAAVRPRRRRKRTVPRRLTI